MSRDLADEIEKSVFVSMYGTGDHCKKCGNGDLTIRIWEAYGSPAKTVGGDIGPTNILAAVIICEACGHSETLSRSKDPGGGVASYM